MTKIFEAPKSSKFLRRARALEALMSFATRIPWPASFVANSVAFPPGAAHRSRTASPGVTGRQAAGVMALGS